MRRYPYDEWILSGRQIFLAEGLDYDELSNTVKEKLHAAAHRRGLLMATRTIFDPPGFVFQAYRPGTPRPHLGTPTQRPTKKTHLPLFCHEDGCENQLRPVDEEFCHEHS